MAFLALVAWASSGPVQWMDNGDLISQAAHDGYFSEHVDALSHPAFHLLSVTLFRLFGVQVLSLLNVFLLLLATILVFHIVRRLGESREIAWLAALGMSSCHAVIWVATKFEVYFLCMDLVLLFVLRYLSPASGLLPRGLVLGFLAGLAVTSHQIALVLLLPFGLALLVTERLLWSLVVGFVAGLFPLYPAIINDLQAGISLVQLLLNFLMVGGGRYHIDYQSSFLDLQGIFAALPQTALLLISFASIAGFGLLPAGQRGSARLIYISGLLVAVFALSYDVDDKFTFLAPGAPFLAISGALFLGRLRWVRGREVLLGLCTFLPVLAMHLAILSFAPQLQKLGRAGGVPERSDVLYYGAPLLGDDSGTRFVQRVARIGGSWPVYADWSSLGALQSAQVAGYLQGLRLFYCGDIPVVDGPQALLLIRRHAQCEGLLMDYTVAGERDGILILRRR